MEIYILTVTYQGVAQAPKVFDTERKAQKFKKKMEASVTSTYYGYEIFKVELSFKMKSFQLI